MDLTHMARRTRPAPTNTVLSTGDRREALRIVRSRAEPLHLLLTDVVMPRMSGRQLAEELRAIRSEVRVLFMSAYGIELGQGGSEKTVGPGGATTACERKQEMKWQPTREGVWQPLSERRVAYCLRAAERSSNQSMA